MSPDRTIMRTSDGTLIWSFAMIEVCGSRRGEASGKDLFGVVSC